MSGSEVQKLLERVRRLELIMAFGFGALFAGGGSIWLKVFGFLA